MRCIIHQYFLSDMSFCGVVVSCIQLNRFLSNLNRMLNVIEMYLFNRIVFFVLSKRHNPLHEFLKKDIRFFQYYHESTVGQQLVNACAFCRQTLEQSWSYFLHWYRLSPLSRLIRSGVGVIDSIVQSRYGFEQYDKSKILQKFL